MWKNVLWAYILLSMFGAMWSVPYWSEWLASSEEERRLASEQRRRHQRQVSARTAPILTVMFAVFAVVMLVGRPDKPMGALLMAALSVCSAAWFVLIVRARRRRRRAKGGKPGAADRFVS